MQCKNCEKCKCINIFNSQKLVPITQQKCPEGKFVTHLIYGIKMKCPWVIL